MLHSTPQSEIGGPTWEIAHWFPPQGHWSEQDYLDLTERSNRLVELTDGQLEVLEMPSMEHQLLMLYLVECLRTYLRDHPVGVALVAPYPTRIRADKYREPDVAFKFTRNLPPPNQEYFEGADLVMEIVSKDTKSQKRDYITKVGDYAEARIPEYWIVDPKARKFTVYTLQGVSYVEHSVAAKGGIVTSRILDGFEVAVDEAFAAAQRPEM